MSESSNDITRQLIEDNIDSLLMNDDLTFDEDSEDGLQKIERYDSDTVKIKSLKKAKNLIRTCLKLYYNEDLITKSEFVQAKTNLACASISTILEQLEVSKHLVNTMVNEIDNGNVHPRMFEVAVSIQNTILELLKNKQLHLIAFQEDMKKIKDDVVNKVNEDSAMIDIEVTQNKISSSNKGDTKLYMSSKNLLKDLDD